MVVVFSFRRAMEKLNEIHSGKDALNSANSKILFSLQNSTMQTQLNPANYHSVAREFLRYHDISPSPSADLALLVQVLQAFMHIPYENLSKIIKFNRFHLDVASLRMPDEVWDDFRRYRLGGTCFSLTFFLHSILDYLGYTCYPVMARMKAGPNHHCAMVVVHGEEHYLADPGYALDIPMPFLHERQKRFRSAHAGIEIRPGERPAHYHLYTFNREQFQWRYEFADVPTPMDEFLQHWLASFTWNGMHGLCLTKIQKDSLIFVHNHFMRETRLQGKKNYNLKSNREQVVNEVFGIPPQIVRAAQEALEANLQWERENGLFKPKARE